MILHNSQKIIARDATRFRVVCAGRRFGKSKLSIEEMKGKALSIKDGRIAYVAPTYAQSRDIIWEELKSEMLPITVSAHEQRLELKVKNLKGGTSMISLRSWDAIETLRGQKFDFIVMDEVAMMRGYWEKWQTVIRPTLTDRKGEALFISTPKGYNHFYVLAQKEKEDQDYKFFHFTTYDNPHIPVEEIDKAKQELSEDQFYQEYMADFRKMEGLIYKEFDRTKHLFDTDPKLLRGNYNWVSVDWGFTNPSAVYTITEDGDRNFFIHSEYYETGKTTDELVDILASRKGNGYYPDPAEPDRIEVMRRRGLTVKDVSKEVVAGIDTLKSLFKNGKIKIHKDCINLINELETYAYKEKKTGGNEQEEPIKENDHACFSSDSEVLTEKGYKPIKDIQVGEILYTPFGNTRVLANVKTGVKKTYEFKDSRITEDHPVLTQRGFVRFDSIRYCDRIMEWGTKQSWLMECDFGDIQLLKNLSFVAILSVLWRSLLATRLNVFTDTYGRNFTERFLKAFISITWTGILLTTTFLTWTWYRLKSIVKNITPTTCLYGEKTCIKPKSQLLHGISLTKLKHFIKNTLSIFGKIKFGLRKNAKSAERNIKRHSQNVQNTATIIAKLKPYGEEEVYSLATDLGLFVVNGIIVSNCDSIRYCLHMRANQALKPKVSVSRPNYGNSTYTSSEQQYKHHTKKGGDNFASPFLRPR
jgi:hypothetical protein